jgi:membrane associated rhomboid family serine protease
MIPLRDNVVSQRTPFVNIAMIGMCGIVFFAQLARPETPEDGGLVERYGMIPARVTHPDEPVVMEVPVAYNRRTGELQVVRRNALPAAVPPVLTLLTCIFLHGGWGHFLGNMWFLWIFGDNVEDRLGHVGYLLFYLGSGIAASLAHLLTDPGSTVPTIGASGAIAGVMGAYFVWYPHSRVQALVPTFGFVHMTELPAPFFLGLWFLLQFLQGTMTRGAEGVAWWAHIGGFAVGVAVAFVFGKSGLLPPPRPERPRDPYPWRHGWN